ncbi:hypothetical protein FSP39_002786 [Pinctada imbricata]|uniref:OTU domain-containing protein n=1 Tax=Pinctada imbricata TaxID=66713 RepID=A0AA89C2D5_PINIB|nr:hypothetical protein FSP39_002786 [Pinctada imbricata]
MSILSKDEKSYLCTPCFLEDVGPGYNFASALTRLYQAAYEGYNHLYIAAKKERHVIPAMDASGPPLKYGDWMSLDLYTKQLFLYSGMDEKGIPVRVTGNGNCFFNSLSMALCGSEEKSTELRVRCTIDMVLNAALHTDLPNSDFLWHLSPSYEEACISAATDKAWSSAWHFKSAANVLGVTIRSVYSPINSKKCKAFQRLNCLFQPLDRPAESEIAIAWTQCGGSFIPAHGKTWVPNHFVPVMERLHDHSTFDTSKFEPKTFSSPILNTNRIELNESSEDEQKLHTSTSILEEVESPESCEELPYMTQSEIEKLNDSTCSTTVDRSESQLSYSTDEEHPSEQGQQTDNKEMCYLPGGKFLSTFQMYSEIKSKYHVHEVVPSGVKSNVYMIVNNKRNAELRAAGKRSDYFDDCGVWDSEKGNTVKTVHLINENMRQVSIKNGLYCTQQKTKGISSWIPISPQPDPSNVLELHKYYTALKRDPTFKKRVSTFFSATDKTISDVAIYEYQGEYPITTSHHGKAANNKRGYKRTHPETMDNIRKMVKDKNPREIYIEAAHQNDSAFMPRDTKTIRNVKYHESKKKKAEKIANHNIADEILNVISMLDNHPYVQEVVHTKDKIPSVICYTEEQIMDLKYFVLNKCGSLGIDRTFNLGHYFVTTIVYKNKRVLKKETGENPIFLGPLFLHRDTSHQTYRSFFAHISAELEVKLIDEIDIRLPSIMVLGSDEEKAITKAIETTFPEATRLLCTKHLKDNVRHYMANIAGIPPNSRRPLANLIFGERGLVNANDTFEFESRSEQIIDACGENEKFKDYFRRNLQPKLLKHVNIPKRKNTDMKTKLWTNNNSESMNNLLKLSVDWRPQTTPDLIVKLYSVTKLQFIDLRRAIYGSGNYVLSADQSAYSISEMKWREKDDEEKKKIFNNFLRDTKKKIHTKRIFSRDGKFSVPHKTRNVAKKPGQRKRPKNERTSNKH